ncbi:hypothetical protein DF268_03750 [Streptomyces sp. V2]|uniref:Secreted protein n=1 Tax=Streptomyces niveiscabiei TaxID=164115 RepID=A0ABW9HUT9_9ACTN|nr:MULTISPECIES: hypothetical protein [Streptomyces]PWG14859.1 hypothetical protein DF268_03750 [Streptomyces sp. V2]
MIPLRHSVLALAALGLTAALSSPAAAAPRHVDVTYGATYVRGDLTFNNRSVSFTGTYRSVSATDCRRAWFGTLDSSGRLLDARSTGTLCNGIRPINTTVPADVRGGAAAVMVCLDNGNAAPLKCLEYKRP